MQSCDIVNRSKYEQYEALFVVMEEAPQCHCPWCWNASDNFEFQKTLYNNEILFSVTLLMLKVCTYYEVYQHFLVEHI